MTVAVLGSDAAADSTVTGLDFGVDFRYVDTRVSVSVLKRKRIALWPAE